MPAPLKNQNAAKPAPDRKSARVWLEVTPRQKSSYVRAARGKSLSGWAAEQLDKAADAIQPDPSDK